VPEGDPVDDLCPFQGEEETRQNEDDAKDIQGNFRFDSPFYKDSWRKYIVISLRELGGTGKELGVLGKCTQH
jgi:hypothetical protein